MTQTSPSLQQELERLPFFTQQNPNSRAIQSNTMYNLWARNNIPWSLDCEAKGNTKENFFI